MSERCLAPVDVHVWLIRDDKVLLLRRSPHAAYAAGLLCAPSGHVEDQEDVVSAAARELFEETGIRVAPEDLRVVHVMQHRGPGELARIGWFFVPTCWTGTPVNREPDKHTELVWADLAALPPDLVAYTRAALDAFADGREYAVHWQGDDSDVGYTPNRQQELWLLETGGRLAGAHPVLREIAAERYAHEALSGVQRHPDGTGRVGDRAGADAASAACDSAFAAGAGTWRDTFEKKVCGAFAQTQWPTLADEVRQAVAVAVNWLDDVRSRTADNEAGPHQ